MATNTNAPAIVHGQDEAGRSVALPIEAASGSVKVVGAFAPPPPAVGAATEAKQDALIALMPAALDAGRLKVALPAGGGGLTDAELRASAVATDPEDRALRDNGKVDIATIDQYTPEDVDSGGGTVNALPVRLKVAGAGGVSIGGDAANGLDVDVTRLPAFITLLAYDGSNNLQYVGYATPGTATSAAGWQIWKLTYTGSLPTSRLAAGGDLLFDNVWDDRAGLAYS
jgi:hypothetical protein